VNETVDPDSPIGRAARDWALAVAGEDFPPARSEQLGAWLTQDARHRAAYAQAEGVLLAASELEDLRHLLDAPIADRRPFWSRPDVRAGGAMALAACLAVGVFLATPPAALESGVGETRTLTLADGSQVVLAPDSRLRQTSRLTTRSLSLQRGEAFFTVAKHDGQAFTVEAAGATVRVVGTRFDVRRGLGGDVRVQVEEGVVKVAGRPKSGGGETTLVAGQQALLGDRPTRVDALPSSEVGSWRGGRLSYVNAPLREVVEDLNRYRRDALILGSERAGALRITAAFEVAQAEGFLANLPGALPVRIITHADGTRTVTDARSRP
jgi:transmembrane sensor